MQNLADFVMSVDVGLTKLQNLFLNNLILKILTWQQNSKPVDRYPRSIIKSVI